MIDIKKTLKKKELSKGDLIFLLSQYNKDERQLIFEKAREVKKKYVGNKIYLRGLIEYSNNCKKNCLYCGIRYNNKKVKRYVVKDEDVLQCADYAFKNNYASIVLQSGEISNKYFVQKISNLLKEIHQLTDNSLKVTLSCGEQTKETYKRWFEAGAHRYLLRIESSNKNIYNNIHPNDIKHNYEKRIQALQNLKEIGYQVGSGIMIGLPEQSIEDLADDLLFLKNINVDMVGMGPYVEHTDTPLYQKKELLLSKNGRYNLSMIMFALLRIIMKDINIASTTALDAISDFGRIEALNIAANVLMPNLTPTNYIANYNLYNNKPNSLLAYKLTNHIEQYKNRHGCSIAYGEHGNSKHFNLRTQKK
ncbi:MAG: [FeFe] hydrogenase H-cluster radical SAM maturase HydE [Bacteroidales bacterium]|nr:[FeFe] hydrogenase H-cluster radical SAM maturase HydE [Bacteroidales bacterium]